MKNLLLITTLSLFLVSCGNTQQDLEFIVATDNDISLNEDYKGERPNDAYLTVFALSE